MKIDGFSYKNAYLSRCIVSSRVTHMFVYYIMNISMNNDEYLEA